MKWLLIVMAVGASGLGVGEHSRMTSAWMLYVSLVMIYTAIMVTINTARK